MSAQDLLRHYWYQQLLHDVYGKRIKSLDLSSFFFQHGVLAALT